MRPSRSIIMLSMFLALLSCNTEVQPEIVVDDALKEKINQKNDILEQLYASGDIDSAATYFHDQLIQMPPNAPAMRGKKAYIEEWKRSVGIGQWKFDLEAIEVRRSGPMAVELGQYQLEFIPNEASPMPGFTDRGNYMVLWEKHENTWKILWDAPVSEMPIGENPQQ